MRSFGLWALGLLTISFLACSDGGGRGSNNPGEFADSDGDGISDVDENAVESQDCDVDGTPNYKDEDSDNDGIPDWQEARPDGQRNTVGDDPYDSDGDGVPNFCSRDSDGNGIDDAEEPGLEVDSDGDGIADRNDPDDDNDRLSDREELDGIFDPPVDSDGDSIPNYLDPDSDNDGILDGDEFNEDSDGDGLKNWEDPDSDNDGILDKDEAGNGGDFRVPPLDTDGDKIPDFLDLDSDNDGLSDTKEKELGTSHIKADTDGDGVTDLIEVAAGTDAFDENDSPRTRGDFVFTIPYEEEAVPRKDTLNFRTNIQYADMYILLDDSGSMQGEMTSLNMALSTAIDELTCDDFGVPCLGDSACDQDQICGAGGSCIESPRTTSCIESFNTGFGLYEAYFRNRLSVQPDPSSTVSVLPTSAGSGSSEKPTLSLKCIADKSQCDVLDISNGGKPCANGGVGCVGFREDAVKIVINVTDEPDACNYKNFEDDGSLATACVQPYQDAVNAMQAAKVTYIGVNSIEAPDPGREPTGTDLRTIQMMEYLSTATGATNQDGEPLWFRGADDGAAEAVVQGVQEVVKNVPLRIQLEPMEESGDAGDILHIIDKIEVNSTGNDPCVRQLNISDSNGDGSLDTFDGVLPGTPVCWDVTVKDNSEAALGGLAIEPTAEPQVFRLRMIVRGNDAIVDERTAYFLVPPKIDQFDIPR